jgi:hypothetical protein
MSVRNNTHTAEHHDGLALRLALLIKGLRFRIPAPAGFVSLRAGSALLGEEVGDIAARILARLVELVTRVAAVPVLRAESTGAINNTWSGSYARSVFFSPTGRRSPPPPTPAPPPAAPAQPPSPSQSSWPGTRTAYAEQL